jgi:transposase
MSAALTPAQRVSMRTLRPMVLLQFQPESALVLWFKKRTENGKGSRKPMIVAFARKLIIALWRYVNTGVVPEGFELKRAA